MRDRDEDEEKHRTRKRRISSNTHIGEIKKNEKEAEEDNSRKTK